MALSIRMRFTMIYPTGATSITTTGSPTTTAGSEGTTQVTSTSVSPSVSTTPGTTQAPGKTMSQLHAICFPANQQYLTPYSFKCCVYLRHSFSMNGFDKNR